MGACEEVLLPLYAGYLEQARAFAAVVPECAGDWREPMRAAYTDSVLAWRRLEARNRSGGGWRTPSTVYFWPDKHGTAGRQLAAALRDRDPTLTEAGLAAKSVGLQSLATLEVLLYGDRIPEQAEFACRYAQAIAQFQAELATRLADAAPGDSATDAAVAETMFRGMQGTLDVLIALDLERPLGADLAARERARAWRSGCRCRCSLRPWTRSSASTPRPVPSPRSSSPVPSSPRSTPCCAGACRRRGRFRRDRRAFASRRRGPGGPAVERLLEELRGVRRLLQERLAPALGLAAGFNALDGD